MADALEKPARWKHWEVKDADIGLGDSAAGIAGRIGVSALASGTASWAVSAASGHAGINSFFHGAAIGAITAAATIGIQYLASMGAQSAISSGANRSPAVFDGDPYEDASDEMNAAELGRQEVALELPLDVEGAAQVRQQRQLEGLRPHRTLRAIAYPIPPAARILDWAL